MGSPENGHAEKLRFIVRQLAARQPSEVDVGEEVLLDVAKRLAAGETVSVPWPVDAVGPFRKGIVLTFDAAQALQNKYGISRSRAYELLAAHGQRQGRRYVLNRQAQERIATEMEPMLERRRMVANRMRASGSSREAAERWVRRRLTAKLTAKASETDGR